MPEKKKMSRHAVRHLSKDVWYYPNYGSIDLVANNIGYATVTRLKRAWLTQMVADLKPLKAQR